MSAQYKYKDKQSLSHYHIAGFRAVPEYIIHTSAYNQHIFYLLNDSDTQQFQSDIDADRVCMFLHKETLGTHERNRKDLKSEK